jgi:hypothetical protein
MNKYRIYRDLALSDRATPAPRRVAALDAVRRASREKKRPDMTWRDHLAMLLHIGAEIEHSLMVQYLYAAYSLGGEQVPPQHRPMVARWQASILSVAKEEMGHLLTVQNILTFIGAPINLDRQELPWDAPFYPFPFRLERLTLDSLAHYVYAEMPAEGHGPARSKHPRKAALGRAIKRAMRGAKVPPHRVGELYDELIALIRDSERIPDLVFQENTYAWQASSDDWGRGYQPDPKLLDAAGSLIEPTDKPGKPGAEAHVMIDRIATRDQAVAALTRLSQQGEAPIFIASQSDELSHFDRFLSIYEELEKVKGWEPSIPVASNPTVVIDPNDPRHKGYISAKHSREWASLFNLRYRMLLKYLAHTFRLARVVRADTPNLRAMIMHRVFGEMYNLKTVAGILVRLPLREGGRRRAGPPFEIPYTLHLGTTELDVWINYRDLIASSQRICQTMLHSGAPERDYLLALFDLDSQARTWIERIIAGLRTSERPYE